MTRTLWSLVLVTLASTTLAGCMGGGSLYTFNSGAADPADVHDTFEASSGRAHVSANAGGSGSAVVTIKDADGTQVFSQSFGTGGGNAQRTVSGAAGTWTIDIDFRNWSGGFNIAITGA